MIANTIFYFTNLNELINHLKVMFFINKNPLTDIYVNSSFRENFFLIIFAMIICTPILKIIKNKIFLNSKYKYSNTEMIFDTCVIILLMSLSTFELLGQSYNPFLYFRF